MSRRIFTLSIITVLAAAFLISAGCEQSPGVAAATPGGTDRAEPSAAAVMYAEQGEISAPDEPPEPPDEPPERVYTGPDLAEGEPVEDGFFSDAAFLGNSLVDGLGRYGGLEQGSFFAATSASVVNVDVTLGGTLESGEDGTLIDAMTEKSYGKIYILLGINEIGLETDYFIRLYGGMLDRIRTYEPEADIYIMSLSPVTEKCSLESEVFNMERIAAYNAALYELAREKECWYVDLCRALAGEDGYLPEDSAAEDGIHLLPGEYPRWADYLRTHVK